MRRCVIFNPTARGEKARRFREFLETVAADCVFKQTKAAGGARPLAAEAVREGFEVVVAAGGDGTLNEVLNGIGDAPDGFERVRLGVLPIGTVNVFGKELNLPPDFAAAWQVVKREREARVDLPSVTCVNGGGSRKYYFAQLAGAGLDARAIELVNWELKKKIGPLSYVWAGFKALVGPLPMISVTSGPKSVSGQLVLIGNGRFYGGRYPIFPRAEMDDGLLDMTVFPRTNIGTLARCLGMLLGGGKLPESVAVCFQAQDFKLTCDAPATLQADGENIGKLPASFAVEKQKLRVLIP